MVYLIGGCPRSGKSTLAREILQKKGIAFTSFDVLAQALKKGLPELGFHTNTDFESYISKCDKYFPFIWPFIKTARHLDNYYCIEGCDFTPLHAKQLQTLAFENNFQIKVCFLGFSEITDYELGKFTHHKSWMHGKPIDQVKLSAENFIRISNYNFEECRKLGIKYFDVSNDLDSAILKAYKYFFN